MTSGNSVEIRPAMPEDIVAIKQLADSHKHELGFLRRPALLEAIERHELLVAENGIGIVGFVEYRHRRDQQTTLYNVVVYPQHRKHGIGRQLVTNLEQEARKRGKSWVLLKCPEDLESNAFYEHIGYKKVTVERGKTRRLNIWRKDLVP
ncbi:MAG: GNAT family N-acetyltransferase [Ardenticatenaceae bacterium]|nr:GNAT family N-acetyltransferase [Anaerolineales bacterium]MCB8918104.1 GNAT family N-acetyltransferase [Ardenticatenaceae bacterium]